MAEKAELIEMTAEIVSAYVGNNAVAAAELPNLIREIYGALEKTTSEPEEAPVEPAKPAVSVRRSIGEDFVICLECGEKLKSLKRHLRASHDLGPEEYRDKWNLGVDYPMVAPSYAKARSELAKQMGLGQKGQTARKGRRSGKSGK